MSTPNAPTPGPGPIGGPEGDPAMGMPMGGAVDPTLTYTQPVQDAIQPVSDETFRMQFPQRLNEFDRLARTAVHTANMRNEGVPSEKPGFETGADIEGQWIQLVDHLRGFGRDEEVLEPLQRQLHDIVKEGGELDTGMDYMDMADVYAMRTAVAQRSKAGRLGPYGEDVERNSRAAAEGRPPVIHTRRGTRRELRRINDQIGHEPDGQPDRVSEDSLQRAHQKARFLYDAIAAIENPEAFAERKAQYEREHRVRQERYLGAVTTQQAAALNAHEQSQENLDATRARLRKDAQEARIRQEAARRGVAPEVVKDEYESSWQL